MKLPGLNGLDLVRELHAAKPRLPLILMTAYGTTDTAIEATKSGAYDYVLKPFNMPELLDLVRKAADSNRVRHEPVTVGHPRTAPDPRRPPNAARDATSKGNIPATATHTS